MEKGMKIKRLFDDEVKEERKTRKSLRMLTGGTGTGTGEGTSQEME